jgi:hypothetical protein
MTKRPDMAPEERERARKRYRAWYKANAERERERSRARYHANPEPVRERKRLWQKTNYNKVREGNRAWSRANREKERARFRAWAEANPEYLSEASRARLAKDLRATALRSAKVGATRRGLEFNLTREHLDSIWPADNRCPCCGIKFEYQRGKTPSCDRIDNSQGEVIGNVRVVCGRCNKLRNDGTAEEHLRIALMDAGDSFCLLLHQVRLASQHGA